MKLQILNYLLGGKTMNTQTRLNQLMSFQENLKQKISNLPEGELCIYQSPSQVQICVYIHLPAMLVRLCCLYLQEI